MRTMLRLACLLLLSTLFLPVICSASNAVLGEIHLDGKSKVERNSGVWVDGEYVGYLKELTGSKKVMLLPGRHTIVIRQAGYKDFTEEADVQPGKKQVISVAMEKAVPGPLSKVTSTVKISAYPSRAAVFVDGLLVGHVGQFTGWGRAMLVEPGVHRVTIALPGYETFEANIDLRPDQKVEIKTDLLKSSAPLAVPLLGPEGTEIGSSQGGAGSSSMAAPTQK